MWKNERDQLDGNLVSLPIPTLLLGVPQLKFGLVKAHSDLLLLTVLPDPSISNGKYVGKDEHTCPSVLGDCGAPLVTPENLCVGIHNAGGDSENGFIEFTASFLKKDGVDFQ